MQGIACASAISTVMPHYVLLVTLGKRVTFQWDHIRLNLPGNADYDPSISWISKIRLDGLIACDIFTFVDDERLSGATRELVW